MEIVLSIFLLVGAIAPFLLLFLLSDQCNEYKYLIPACFVLISVMSLLVLIYNACYFLSVASFKKDRVIVYTLFRRKFEIKYSDISDIGVSFYIHGILGSNIGSKVKYIHLSKRAVPNGYRKNINFIKPNKSFIKLAYNEKNYRDLANILPNDLSTKLSQSIEDMNKQGWELTKEDKGRYMRIEL